MRVFLSSAMILICLCSCNNSRKKAERIVGQWMGKEIIIPADIPYFCAGKDSDNVKFISDADYRILLYTDSIGCISCKLQLEKWKMIIKQANDSLQMKGKLDFLFFFHPKNEKDINYVLKRDAFYYPVFIDHENRIDSLNHFPSDMSFQCFLLDRNNRVLSIGNPVHNPQVWSLYKEIITGEKEEVKETVLAIDRQVAEAGDMRVGEEVELSFVLRNTGNMPLVIKDIVSACGCTVPSWERKPVKPGGSTSVQVSVKPDQKGLFQKTVQVYCNIKEKHVGLLIKGNVR